MLKNTRYLLLAVTLLLTGREAFAAVRDVPVPSTCTADVNRGLQQLIHSQTKRNMDNIMVCGVATQNSRVQSGGPHGSHHIISLSVDLPDYGKVMVQVVINDALDGVVTADTGESVMAYGQGYIAHGAWVAGVHDVHCSTHPTADNGWVVVAGVKTPAKCAAGRTVVNFDSNH